MICQYAHTKEGQESMNDPILEEMFGNGFGTYPLKQPTKTGKER
jgi:hypothetical protein